MDTDWLIALPSMVLSFTVVGVIVSLYIRLGRLETVLKAGRERSDAQHEEARERSDKQFREAREGSDAQCQALRDWSEAQFREARERSDAQHAEILAEIRRVTDGPFPRSHAPDGSIIFRVVPPSGSNLPE